MHSPIGLEPLLAALAPRRPKDPEPAAPRPGQSVTLVACAPPQPTPISDPDSAVHLHFSAVQAIEAGQFPAWFADACLNNAASAHGADRQWLEGLGRSLDDALRGDHSTRGARLQTLASNLAMEIWGGPNRQAAEFFLMNVVVDLRDSPEDAVRGGSGSLTDMLRAIHDPSATIALAHWIADAPTPH